MDKLDTINAKIIRLVSGEEIACTIDATTKSLTTKARLLRIKSPMLIKYVPQFTEFGLTDYIALVRWVGFTNDSIVTIPIDKIMTICNATPEFHKRYNTIIGKLKNTKENLPNYIERNLSADEHKQLDEEDNIDRTKLDKLGDILNMPSKKVHQLPGD